MLMRVATAVLALAAALAASAAQALPDKAMGEPLILVATPQLVADPVYQRSVLLAVPIEQEQHLGFIINRPTGHPLSELLPQEESAKSASDPVYFGGPQAIGTLFALVHTTDSPGPGSIAVMEKLHLAINAATIDHVLATSPNDARYFVGIVVWRPGELEHELKQGFWKIEKAKTETVFRKDMTSLWAELSTSKGTVTTRGVEAGLPSGLIATSAAIAR